MSVRIIGCGCVNGRECNPGKPARPVYQAGKCYPCWASGRVAERLDEMRAACCMCGGDPRGGEVAPVFGDGLGDVAGSGHASLPEPLLFCRECASRARTARQETASIDALELWALLPTFDPELRPAA